MKGALFITMYVFVVHMHARNLTSFDLVIMLDGVVVDGCYGMF